MFLFLSFIVVFIALFLLGGLASSYHYSEEGVGAAVILLIYSLVCIVKELKESTEDYFDNNYSYNNRGNYYNRNNYSNYNSGTWSNQYNSRNVEVFAPDKKEEKKAERPKVLHYPSNKEVRDKISDLEKNKLWKIKRGICSFWGIDITESLYNPTYVEEEAVVKANKENHSRYMPGNDWYLNEEKKEYNEVAKHLSRSCDIAFDGENFVENEDIK